jgi:hypothetical protein
MMNPLPAPPPLRPLTASVATTPTPTHTTTPTRNHGHDPQSFAVFVTSLDPHSVTQRQAADLCRRARALQRVDVLPAWLSALARPDATPCDDSATTSPSSSSSPNPALQHDPSTSHQVLEAKAHEHNLPIAVLRTVFMRGLREFCSLDTPPPTAADEFAQARVNTFIRLHYGDLDVRDVDSDLLSTR